MKIKPKAPKPEKVSTRTSTPKASISTTASPSKSIRIKRPYILPVYVKQALQKLNEAGHVAYVVGGSVRDFLLDKESKDHDLATSAEPNELCRIFPDAITVGKNFGVIKVPTHSEPPLLEIATFRQDLEYEDYRHPKGVVYSGPTEDAKRRDFTVNALFFDPKTSRILDFVGGIQDLKAGVIRAIGDPEERFREDALRLLRAIRFKTRLGFELHPETAEAIKSRAKLISKVSPERIRDELTLTWTGPRPTEALVLLSELGILEYILPEVEALRHLGKTSIPNLIRHEDLWAHLLKTLDCLVEQNPIRSATLSWAAILHEIGRPVALKANQGKTFNGHETESTKMALKISSRMKMARWEGERISSLVADHLKFRDVFQMREATLQRFIRQENFEDLLAFHRADAIAWDGNLAYYEFCSSRLKQYKKSYPHAEGITKVLDGTDLIQLGFQPGPEFSEILRFIEDLTLEGKIRTKEEALEYVVRNFVK